MTLDIIHEAQFQQGSVEIEFPCSFCFFVFESNELHCKTKQNTQQPSHLGF